VEPQEHKNTGNTPLIRWDKEEENWKGRDILSIAASHDEGLAWEPVFIKDSPLPKGDIENHRLEKTGEYSYPAIIQDSQGTIHLVYTVGRKNIKHVALKAY
jgi:alpha-L-fucosidase